MLGEQWYLIRYDTRRGPESKLVTENDYRTLQDTQTRTKVKIFDLLRIYRVIGWKETNSWELH